MKRLWLLACVLALVAVPSWASGIGAGVGYWDTSDAEDDTGFGMKLSPGRRRQVEHRLPRRVLRWSRPGFGPARDLDRSHAYRFGNLLRLPDQEQGHSVRWRSGFNYTLYQSEVYNTLIGQPETSRIKDEPGWYGVFGIDIPFNKRIAFYAEGHLPREQADGSRVTASPRSPRFRWTSRVWPLRWAWSIPGNDSEPSVSLALGFCLLGAPHGFGRGALFH